MSALLRLHAGYHSRMCFWAWSVKPIWLRSAKPWKFVIVGIYVRFGWRYASVSLQITNPWVNA